MMQSSKTHAESSNLGQYLNLASPRIFYCYFCPQSFKTKQALGGHQNAHRDERRRIRQHFVQERGKFSEILAAANKASAIAVNEPKSTVLSLGISHGFVPIPSGKPVGIVNFSCSNGLGLKKNPKPRNGQRFEPYSKGVKKCNRSSVDHDIAWVFKGGIAPLGLSSGGGKNEKKTAKEFMEAKEDGNHVELVNLDLTL